MKRDKAGFEEILNFLMIFSTFLYIVMSFLYVFNPRNYNSSWWWVGLLLIFVMLSPLLLFTLSVLLTLRAGLRMRKSRTIIERVVFSLYSVGAVTSFVPTVITVIRHFLQLVGKPYHDINQWLYMTLPIFGWICIVCVVTAFVIELVYKIKNKSPAVMIGGLYKKPIVYIICGIVILSLLFVPFEKRKFGIDGDDIHIYHRYEAFICSYVGVEDTEKDDIVDRTLLFFPKNYYKTSDLF